MVVWLLCWWLVNGCWLLLNCGFELWSTIVDQCGTFSISEEMARTKDAANKKVLQVNKNHLEPRKTYFQRVVKKQEKNMRPIESGLVAPVCEIYHSSYSYLFIYLYCMPTIHGFNIHSPVGTIQNLQFCKINVSSSKAQQNNFLLMSTFGTL